MNRKTQTQLALKYRSYIIIAAFVLFVIALMVITYQYFIQRKQEIAHIREIVISRAYEVDSLIKATKDRVSEIYHFTQEQLSKEEELPQSPMVSHFIDGPGAEYFRISPDGDEVDFEQFGLIYGKGSFQKRESSFYKEVNSLLSLLPVLRVSRQLTPHLAWIYYFSDKRISVANPGALLEDFLKSSGTGFTEYYRSVYSAEWWRESQPETNPQANPLWTKVYLDDGGKGLMITYAIPVRVAGNFRGVVAGDITLDFMSHTLRRSEHARGMFLIVSDHSEVLGSTKGESGQLYSLTDLLPKPLRSKEINFQSESALQHFWTAGYNLFIADLNQAPWRIVFILSESEIAWEILPSFAIHLVALILFFGILITGYKIIDRAYVRPAINLVEHIELEANDRPVSQPKVPALWMEWFDHVSQTFRERRELNRELEARVEERTKELQIAKSAAEAASTAKSNFLANMSHELRTPLNAILGFTQLMRRDTQISKKNLENLNIINRSGEHLLSLINDILDMSKIEAGRATLEPVHFDLFATLETVEDMFRVQAEKKGLNFTVVRNRELPQYICTDEMKLRQTLMNLLSNAVKFTNKGAVTLRIVWDKEREGIISFEVEDTGTGISPEEREKIFEPFVQTSRGQRSREGTGLGLSISRQFAQLMGGDLKVGRKEGKGSIFEFTVKFTPAPIEQIKKHESGQRVIGLTPNQKEYRILIVEDNEMNRTLLYQLLQSVGFKVHTAENGIEAIEHFNTWRPHFIWMDMQMPIMNGYEAARHIKAASGGRETPIVALTASVFEEEKEEVFSAGCDDFLRKPFRETEIFELLGKYLGVRYTYEETGTEEYDIIVEKGISQHSMEALSALPESLLEELKGYVEEINLEGTSEVIDRIGEIDEMLKKELTKLLKEFRFDTLQQLLRKIDDERI